jgi:ankyrin repeat protein
VSQLSHGGEFIHAVQLGSLEKVQELLEKDPRLANAVEESGYSPLLWAVQNRRENVAALLLSYNAAVNAAKADGMTPLHLAAYKGDSYP